MKVTCMGLLAVLVVTGCGGRVDSEPTGRDGGDGATTVESGADSADGAALDCRCPLDPRTMPYLRPCSGEEVAAKCRRFGE